MQYQNADWSQSMQSLVDGAKGWMEEVKRESTLDLVRYLVDLTPKDTTNASKAWVLSVGTPAYTVFDGLAVGRNPVAEAFRELMQRPEGEIHITNSERYITALEYGHSKQAPHGFMAYAVAAWPQFVSARAATAKANGWNK